MGFEERFSKVGKALDDAKEKVRLPGGGAGGEPLVDRDRFRERYASFKATTHAKAEHLWVVYQEMPKAKAAAVALGGLCVVLVVTVLVLMNTGPSAEKLPSRAKADEIATMAALRAKMSPNATGSSGPAPKR